MNGVNGKAIQKAIDIIGEITDDGKKLKRYKISPSDFYEFYDGVQRICKTGIATTISEACKNLYVRCGFTAEVDYIGWKINGII